MSGGEGHGKRTGHRCGGRWIGPEEGGVFVGPFMAAEMWLFVSAGGKGCVEKSGLRMGEKAWCRKRGQDRERSAGKVTWAWGQ